MFVLGTMVYILVREYVTQMLFVDCVVVVVDVVLVVLPLPIIMLSESTKKSINCLYLKTVLFNRKLIIII